MLVDFFKLNNVEELKELQSQQDFINLLITNEPIKDYIYIPNNLYNILDNESEEIKPNNRRAPNLKIRTKTFINVSFKSTLIKGVDFQECHFEDCLFLGTNFEDCKFIECSFKGVNTYGIKISNTYINPSFFDGNFKGYNPSYSNIIVQLYQVIYNNSRDLELTNFARKAKYNIQKWEGNLLISKFKYKRPYKISFLQFISQYIPNYLSRKVFGYGLRLRNFIITFTLLYSICFLLNMWLWDKYNLKNKDILIESFCASNYSNLANFFFTTDMLTKIIDSQFQPTSNLGMVFLTIQSGLGLILFTFLITVLINRFVK